jgi:hypothetical protein
MADNLHKDAHRSKRGAKIFFTERTPLVDPVDQSDRKSSNPGPLARRMTGLAIAITLAPRLQVCRNFLPGYVHKGDLMLCNFLYSFDILNPENGAIGTGNNP